MEDTGGGLTYATGGGATILFLLAGFVAADVGAVVAAAGVMVVRCELL